MAEAKNLPKIDRSLRMITRKLPIFINNDGELIDPEGVYEKYLFMLFEEFEYAGDVALQANLEIRILIKAK